MLYRPTPDRDADAFDVFWRTSPRRQGGKLEAEKEYRKALLHANPLELQTGMEAYAAYVKAQGFEEQYIVTPAAWLRRGMWADEYPVPKEQPEPPSRAMDWYHECVLLHQGSCGGSFKHHVKMQIEAEKAKRA